MKSACLWGIGRNYKDHAAEMQAAVPTQPLVFLKSGGCLTSGPEIPIPKFVKNLHHEIELAVRLNNQLQPESVALALDLTARDLQNTAKQQGHPWTLAKSFIGACPHSPWIKFQSLQWWDQLSFELQVNGQSRQVGKTGDMIFSLSDLLDYLKAHYPLAPQDIILTGTPAGVGALSSGDQLHSEINNELEWDLKVQ